MLREEQLERYLNKNVAPVYLRAEDDMLRDLARRLKRANYATPTAMWQIQKARDMNILYDDLIKTLARYNGPGAAAIEGMLRDAALDSVAYDAEIYKRAGQAGLLPSYDIPPSVAEYMEAQLNAAARAAGDQMRLTGTRALQGAQAFFSAAVDKAYLSVSAGLSTGDAALRQALRELGAQGIHTVNYASGRRLSYEAAVRMNMVTATNQACGRLAETHMQALGANLVMATSHAGARPDHAAWQGKIFWTNKPEGNYEELRAATGYGTVTGLCGANCRHSFYPYFENISSKNSFSRDPARDELGIDNDVLYEQTQKQRALERKIRAAKRTGVVADAAGDAELAAEAGARVRAAQKDMRDYLKAHEHLARDYIREAI